MLVGTHWRRGCLLSVVVGLLSVMLSFTRGLLGSPAAPEAAQRATPSARPWLDRVIATARPAEPSSSSSSSSSPTSADKIHLVVLVHGWLGNPAELGYLRSAIERCAAPYQADRQFFLVHSVAGNEGRTSDGVAAGGSRVAREVDALLDELAPHAGAELSLSFVGHSLGGLYARYALSELRTERTVGAGDGGLARRTVPVQLKVFCTTATPHLGVAGYTYLPLPRLAEYAVATLMQPTGRDLFRLTDTLERLATEPRFLAPLARFARRIAYANAHATDFQVPTATAAFLADIDSPHHRVKVDRAGAFVAVAVETEQRPLESLEAPPLVTGGDAPRAPLSAAKLAARLDALGWEKVFYDVRETLPSWRNPFAGSQAQSPVEAEATSEKDTFTSAELLAEYASWKLERLHFPMGHNILVANAKNELYAKMNAAGQPVMDQLAANVVHEITGTPAPAPVPG